MAGPGAVVVAGAGAIVVDGPGAVVVDGPGAVGVAGAIVVVGPGGVVPCPITDTGTRRIRLKTMSSFMWPWFAPSMYRVQLV